MAESQLTSAPATEEEDLEWEYEYHETETESFYVTLDISSAVDYKNPRTKKKKPDPPPPKFPQPTTSIAPTSPVAQENADPSQPAETPIPETPAPMEIDQILGPPEEDPSLSVPKDRIQILDLHTQNPLISYQNQMYSCEWTSTLGTDLLLTTPTPDFSHPVLREKPNVSVLAASSIKLMCRPAQIANRHSAEESALPSTPAPESPIASPNTVGPEKATPVKIPLGATPSRARQNQANFLERLIAIKAQKGEKDSVTIHTQKVNQGTGWRSQRKASEAMEDGDDEFTPKQSRQGRATVGRPRGSRRTRGPRTAKGGLFRDYRPQLWDTPGADIRAGPSSTPENWDHLEDRASDGRRTPAITTVNTFALQADQPVQTANGNSSSLSASASAHASSTPLFRPVQSINGEPSSSYALATPSPSLALSLGLQPAIVTGESVVPASRVPDTELLQQK
ncbi:MAG: hypothetical protein Q9175_004741 [Cornicularia normoerica]